MPPSIRRLTSVCATLLVAGCVYAPYDPYGPGPYASPYYGAYYPYDPYYYYGPGPGFVGGAVFIGGGHGGHHHGGGHWGGHGGGHWGGHGG
jgi:hypothetical protein